MSVSLVPVNDKSLAADLIAWLVANALQTGGDANFVDGENADEVQVAGTVHLFKQFGADQPDDSGIVFLETDRETSPATPVREAQLSLLLRAAGSAAVSGRIRVEAFSKAVTEFMRDSNKQTKTVVTMPSGRRILSFTQIQISPGSPDGSGRAQDLIEFRLEYIDQRLQSA